MFPIQGILLRRFSLRVDPSRLSYSHADYILCEPQLSHYFANTKNVSAIFAICGAASSLTNQCAHYLLFKQKETENRLGNHAASSQTKPSNRVSILCRRKPFAHRSHVPELQCTVA